MLRKQNGLLLFIRRFAGSALILFLAAVCVIGCQRSVSKGAANESQNDAPHVVAQDFSVGELKAHYLKHRYDFGDSTIEEYLEGARSLLNAQPGKDVLEKIRPNGDVLHYRLSTGEFSVMTQDGRIRTYFKTNYRYWMQQ